MSDDIHDWVGQEAAARAGAPVSLDNLTEDERTLRDLAYPLIVPPYDRLRWNVILHEYGIKREFRNSLWVVDPTAYYRALQDAAYRSTAGRYNRLIDDIRNDVSPHPSILRYRAPCCRVGPAAAGELGLSSGYCPAGPAQRIGAHRREHV